MGFMETLDRWINGNNTVSDKNSNVITNALIDGAKYGCVAGLGAFLANKQLNKMYPGYRSVRGPVKLYVWALAVLTVIHYNMEDVVSTSVLTQRTDVDAHNYVDREKHAIDEFRRQKQVDEQRALKKAAAASTAAAASASAATTPVVVTKAE